MADKIRSNDENSKVIFEVNKLIYSSLSEIDDLDMTSKFDAKANVTKLKLSSSNRFWIIRLLLIPDSLEFLKSSYRLVLGRESVFSEYSMSYRQLITGKATRVAILNTMFSAESQVEINKYTSKLNIEKIFIKYVHGLLGVRYFLLMSRRAWMFISKNNKAHSAELSSHLNVTKHKHLISFKVSEQNDIELEIMARDWIEYNRNLKKVS